MPNPMRCGRKLAEREQELRVDRDRFAHRYENSAELRQHTEDQSEPSRSRNADQDARGRSLRRRSSLASAFRCAFACKLAQAFRDIPGGFGRGQHRRQRGWKVDAI